MIKIFTKPRFFSKKYSRFSAILILVILWKNCENSKNIEKNINGHYRNVNKIPDRVIPILQFLKIRVFVKIYITFKKCCYYIRNVRKNPII